MSPIAPRGTKRYFAYIRVSTAKQGERGVSLQEQREAIVRFAERNALTIVQWFEERETAAKRGRRVFTMMLRQLRSGKVDGVIIHKIDRSARNLKDWADLGQLIDRGIEIHFCHESIDLHSRGGRLTADIQAVVAADFIRNLRDETRKGIAGRLKQGLYPFRAPLGYLDRGGGNLKEPDPATAPLVKWAFEQYATGSLSLENLIEALYERGLRNQNGGRISMNGLSIVLNNPFYMGVIRLKRTGETFAGGHQPIVTADLFERVQHVLAGRRQRCGMKHDFLFRRMLVCRLCGKTLTGEIQKGHVYYRCHTRGCATTCVRERDVEDAVRKVLASIQLAEHEADEIRDEIERLRSRWTSDRRELIASLSLSLGQVQKRLDRLIDAFVDGAIDSESFYERKARLNHDRQLLNEKLASARQSQDVVVDRLSRFFELSKTAYQSYIKANPYEKRETVEMVTSNRWVDRKNVVIEPRIPFLALAKWRFITKCAPQRETVRTFLDNTPQDVPDVPNVPTDSDQLNSVRSFDEIAHIIIRYFAQ